jgi:hypothetical protein
MTVISDVFAFAAQNADYWTEFLSGADYPEELTEDEIRALTAAREHVDSLVVEILHATGATFAARLGEDKVPKKRFNGKNTTANRSISLPPPLGLDGKLYQVQYSLRPNEAATAVELCASLIVKKSALDALHRSLSERNIEHSVSGYEVCSKGLPIVASAEVAELAARSAKQAILLLSGFDDPPAVSPPAS